MKRKQEKKKQAEDAETQRKKLEKLKLEKAEEEKKSRQDKEKEEPTGHVIDMTEEEHEKKEEMRMAKAFGLVSPRSQPENKLISPRPAETKAVSPRPAEVKTVSPRHVETKTVDFGNTEDEEERKEEARMAKMFAGVSPRGAAPAVSPRPGVPVENKTINNGLFNSPDQAHKEAERFSKAMGVDLKKLDPHEAAKERERKALEQRIAEADTSDPKAFSRQFLNDPEMLARLKDVKGILAVQQLKGVDVPGHKF